MISNLIHITYIGQPIFVQNYLFNIITKRYFSEYREERADKYLITIRKLKLKLKSVQWIDKVSKINKPYRFIKYLSRS